MDKRDIRRAELIRLYQQLLQERKSIHDPVRPGILKKRIGKLTCTKVRIAKQQLKDKGTNYAKALQRYLNYHCRDERN